MFVVLDREDSVYTAGETVKGRVHIVLTQDVKVKDLVVRFYGYGRVSWDEQRAYTKGSAPSVSCKNTEIYMDYSMSLLKKDATSMRPAVPLTITEQSDDGIVLPAGNHCFPFEYILPRNLPSTYEGRWGQAKYVVKAALQRPWKFDIDRETELNVKAFVDLNDEPELARPIGGLSEFTAGIMCVRSGPITVELRVGRRGYVPGDTIQLSADVDNSSRYKLYHCHLALVQHATFRAGRKLRKTSVTVSSVDKGDILPGTTAQWNSDTLTVPVLPPTSSKGHRNIEIRYTVSLFVKYSSWTEPFCLPVTVSIGTVALRRQTINTYLAMLGYGQTPRGSPSSARKISIIDSTTTGRPGLMPASTSSDQRRPSLETLSTANRDSLRYRTILPANAVLPDIAPSLPDTNSTSTRSRTGSSVPQLRTKLTQVKSKNKSQENDEIVTES